MNIHEYQAKQLLAGYGVAVPRGKPAFTADDAQQVAQELGGSLWVVKSKSTLADAAQVDLKMTLKAAACVS